MHFTTWVTYLKVITVFFILQGLLWAFIGSFDPLGIYEEWMAASFFKSGTLPANASKVFRFILAPFGATTAGYFLLQYFITIHAFAKKQKWAYQAIASAFLFWFVVDTTLSIYHQAFFNIFLANIPALVITLPVLIFTRKYFHDQTEVKTGVNK